MSWLAALFDKERGEPFFSRDMARALARPSLPEPESVSFESAPHCQLGFAKWARTARERRAMQPFVDRERGIHVIADIRLDNRQELADLLGLDPHDGLSDIAILAEGHARFGRELASRLVGSFAYVVWDARSRTLHAARDPMGERPLYYRIEGPRLWLASSVEQLLHVESGIPPIEDEMVLGFLGGEVGSRSSTFFRGIRRLPPGHVLEASVEGGGEPRLRRYWHPPEAFLRLPRTEDYHARFRELLDDAVRARLDTDGPILAHLSGGLDSSSIACLADRLYRLSPEGRPPLRLVSGLYPGLDCDESAFIREVRTRVSLPWESFDATRPDFCDLERPFLDFPGGRSSQAGSAGDLAIAEREGARVLLSGFGGDDVGAEVGIFRDLAAMGRFGALFRETLLVPDFHWGRREWLLVDAMKGLLPHPLHEAHGRWRRGRSQRLPSWAGPVLRELRRGSDIEGEQRPRRWLSHVQRWLFDAFTQAERAHCVEVQQRQAAEVGVEVRFPFFDVRLASFVLAIPPEHRLPGGSYRVLQRKAMAGLVPDAVLGRHRPTTFESAFLARAQKGLPRLRPILEEGEWLSAPYADRSELRKIARKLAFVSSPEAHFAEFRAIENVVLLEAWLRALRAEPSSHVVRPA